MNGTRHGCAISLYLLCSYFVFFFSHLELEVDKCWGCCLLGKLIDLTAVLMPHLYYSLRNGAFSLVALAVIVLKHWHVTHCLGLVNICWVKKGILETQLFCVSFLLSFFVFTDSVFLHSLASLLFHIQISHSRSSWSVPIQSGVTRKQGSHTSYQWDA